MPSEALFAFGTLLQMGDGADPEVFTTIAEVKDISGPSLSQDTVETTTHSSASRWKEFMVTLKDSGELSFDLNFVPGNATHDHQTGLLSSYNAGTLDHYRLLFPDGSGEFWAFSAFVTAFEPSAPVADILGASVTLKVSGPVLFGQTATP